MRPDSYPNPSPTPDLSDLDRRMFRQWDLGANPTGAVDTAREVGRRLAQNPPGIDLDETLKAVWRAAEILWDSMALDDAAALVELWRQTVARVAEERDVDPGSARTWATILSAELEHRLRRFSIAVDYALIAIEEITALAGDRETLRAMLKLGKVTVVTELYCAVLAIGIPAARMHFVAKPALRSQYLDRWIRDATLILRRDLPPPLHRIHALVIQTFFAIAKRPDWPEAEHWIDRLERFDDLVRPKTPRGQNTLRLRFVVRAEFDGDVELAIKEAHAADADLVHMPRHKYALAANRWWPPAMSGGQA